MHISSNDGCLSLPHANSTDTPVVPQEFGCHSGETESWGRFKLTNNKSYTIGLPEIDQDYIPNTRHSEIQTRHHNALQKNTKLRFCTSNYAT